MKQTIGVVAPSSPSTNEKLEEGRKTLHDLGYKTIIAPSCYATDYNYTSEETTKKANDIMDMFLNDDVDLIMCMKGGYGTPRLVDLLDYDIIKNNYKPFIGFSDITTLLNTIHIKTNHITYHGPMVIGDFSYDFSDVSYKSFLTTIHQTNDIILQADKEKTKSASLQTVKGRLLGGNLSLLHTTLATPYDIDYHNTILFIEEVHEPRYRVDRMLQSFRLKGVFHQIKALVVGQLTYKKHQEYYDLFEQISTRYNIPLLYGLQVGHVVPRHTLPIGREVIVDLNTHCLVIPLERTNDSESK